MFRKIFGVALIATLIACTEDGPGGGGGGGTDAGSVDDRGNVVIEDGGVVDPPDSGVVTPALAESAKATLRFKRNERLRNDFAQALGLTPAQLCNELGLYSCTDFVHTIALGGVEPYTLGLRESLPNTTVTAPNAVDRVALAGCEKRVTMDFDAPASAVIYRDLPVDPDGTLGDLTAAGVAESIDRLYKRAVLRPASAEEVEHMRALYTELAATGEPNAAREWAILSCYAVLTTMESLFY